MSNSDQELTPPGGERPGQPSEPEQPIEAEIVQVPDRPVDWGDRPMPPTDTSSLEFDNWAAKMKPADLEAWQAVYQEQVKQVGLDLSNEPDVFTDAHDEWFDKLSPDQRRIYYALERVERTLLDLNSDSEDSGLDLLSTSTEDSGLDLLAPIDDEWERGAEPEPAEPVDAEGFPTEEVEVATEERFPEPPVDWNEVREAFGLPIEAEVVEEELGFSEASETSPEDTKPSLVRRAARGLRRMAGRALGFVGREARRWLDWQGIRQEWRRGTTWFGIGGATAIGVGLALTGPLAAAVVGGGLGTLAVTGILRRTQHRDHIVRQGNEMAEDLESLGLAGQHAMLEMTVRGQRVRLQIPGVDAESQEVILTEVQDGAQTGRSLSVPVDRLMDMVEGRQLRVISLLQQQVEAFQRGEPIPGEGEVVLDIKAIKKPERFMVSGFRSAEAEESIAEPTGVRPAEAGEIIVGLEHAGNHVRSEMSLVRLITLLTSGKATMRR